ncbi:hypothetical protein MHYP_G00349610 [Metynnis hypsauchen]
METRRSYFLDLHFLKLIRLQLIGRCGKAKKADDFFRSLQESALSTAESRDHMATKEQSGEEEQSVHARCERSGVCTDLPNVS